MDIRIIQILLGHSSLRSTEIYTNLTEPLRDAFRRDQKLMYGLLMQVSAEAVKELCAKKRHLGALPGVLSVLHTWNGQLSYARLLVGGFVQLPGLLAASANVTIARWIAWGSIGQRSTTVARSRSIAAPFGSSAPHSAPTSDPVLRKSFVCREFRCEAS